MAGVIVTVPIRQVSGNDATAMWGLLLPYVEQALDECLDDFTPDDVLEAVQKGMMQLWLVGSSAVYMTQVVEYPHNNVLVGALCGGHDGPEWFGSMDEELYKFAQRERCDTIRLYNRRGWARVLTGYKEVGVILERQVWAT